MLEVLVGFIVLIIPYLLGCIINILIYGFSFKDWEGIGRTYAGGIFILIFLLVIGIISYYIGHYVMLIIK